MSLVQAVCCCMLGTTLFFFGRYVDATGWALRHHWRQSRGRDNFVAICLTGGVCMAVGGFLTLLHSATAPNLGPYPGQGGVENVAGKAAVVVGSGTTFAFFTMGSGGAAIIGGLYC